MFHYEYHFYVRFATDDGADELIILSIYTKNTAVYYRHKRRTPTRTRKCQLHSIEPTLSLMWSESVFCCPKTPNTNLRLISFLCIFLLRCPLPTKIKNVFW